MAQDNMHSPITVGEKGTRIMDYTSVIVALSILWIIIKIFTIHHRSHHRSSTTSKLPPRPPTYPIIGNILDLGNKPHQSLANLSKTYGPVMTLKLGSVTTIVVSSPKTAQLVLQKHDQIFSGRSVMDAATALDHHRVSIAWLPVDTHFRNLRKLCNSQVFSLQRLEANQGLRRKKLQELLDYVHEACMKCASVEIGRVAYVTSLNVLSNTFFSVNLANYCSSFTSEFKHLSSDVAVQFGRTNLVDYFPSLRRIDPQGVRRGTAKCVKSLLSFFEGIINQRLESGGNRKNDVLDAMLRITKEDGSKLSCYDLKHLFMDLFLAGTDTTSKTLECAMAELFRNPTTMIKAQAELREVLDKSKPIQESDILKLPYLQAVVKEIFRLHPVAPLLLPHKAGSDIEIDGFVIPQNAKVLVNVWAIGRDPSIWANPSCFMPERFLDQKIDVKGFDFELIPFGAGRRICPGLSLAHRLVHLMLASLLLHFDWKLEDGMKPEDMDMSSVLQNKEPLLVVPIRV